MMRWLTFFLLCIALQANAQAPINDLVDDAINIQNPETFCSADAAYNNINATVNHASSGLWTNGPGKDVWFKFTAVKFDVNITISGKVNAVSTNTMINPLVGIYTRDLANNTIAEVFGTMLTANNVTSLYRGALTIGQVYYIRVSAANNNEGTFKLCMENFFPPLAPGQDCGSFSVLCSMEKFTQATVRGAGLKNTESAGTCLGQESNSAWYKWTAAKSGPFTFLITPKVTTDDIDWILYDLGPGGDCSNVSGATAIRCASGSGVTCTPSYYVTGLSMDETELTEQPGCPTQPQNGLVRYVDMIEGHNYALLVDNYSSPNGNNGFTIEFGGTTAFAGPSADISMTKINACTPQQSFEFTSLATNYNSLKWTFGEGASMANATGEGPYIVTYDTPGDKVVVLEVEALGGCTVVKTIPFTVSLKPSLPTVSYTTVKLCPGNIVTFQTPKVDKAIYHWTGPDGFTKTEQNPEVTITGPENSGNYTLIVQVGDCFSDPATVNVPSIDVKPEAFFDFIITNECQPNQSYTFRNGAKNYASLIWEFGPGEVSRITAANGDVTVTYNTAGIKDIVLIAKSSSGCETPFSLQINVQLKPAKPIITINRPKFCLGDVIKLAINEIPEVTYHWLGPNGFTGTTAALEIPVTDFAQAGTYQVFIQIGNCKSDVARIIIPPIAKVPVASFTTTPSYHGKYVGPFPMNFINKSKDADTYLWDFGDTFTSTEESPSHVFKQSGTYKIKLTAFADEGCSTTTDIGDLIIRDATLFIPNSFSPNGDGVNDEFVVTVLNLKKYRILIYNRAGENIFQSADIFDNWKGKYKNQDVPVGVYYYVIYGTNIYDIDVKYSGSLTLIR